MTYIWSQKSFSETMAYSNTILKAICTIQELSKIVLLFLLNIAFRILTTIPYTICSSLTRSPFLITTGGSSMSVSSRAVFTLHMLLSSLWLYVVIYKQGIILSSCHKVNQRHKHLNTSLLYENVGRVWKVDIMTTNSKAPLNI